MNQQELVKQGKDNNGSALVKMALLVMFIAAASPAHS